MVRYHSVIVGDYDVAAGVVMRKFKTLYVSFLFAVVFLEQVIVF